MALTETRDQKICSDAEIARSRNATTIIAAIVILLIYQGYSLSVVGVASPWIAKSFGLDQAKLAELFAWMSLSAFGALILARLADRVGRRRIISGVSFWRRLAPRRLARASRLRVRGL